MLIKGVEAVKKAIKIIKYLAIIGVLIAVIIELDIIRFGSIAKAKNSDCIIVLGCQVKGTVPSPFLQRRLKEGIRLYKEGYGKHIIVSGGQGPGEDISEAEAMKKYLLDNGIDEASIIMEDKSKNTMENLAFSKEVMEAKDFKTAVVVSNKFHLRRVSLMCKSLDLNTNYSGVFVSEHKASEYKGYVREVPGILKFWVRRK
jgi:uncharacterized SAM-binding protein YcdF (DUF218 family)